MSVDWDQIQQAMYPIKDYADLRRRWQDAFSYPFVRETYNFALPEIADYTQRLLGEDSRNRYTEYAQKLEDTFNQLHQAGVQDLLDLVAQVDTSELFEAFIDQSKIQAEEVVAALKYLIYWVIPANKYLSALVTKDSPLLAAILVLRDLGIRTNLDILQQGLTPAERKTLAKATELPETKINELVNRADFSRMPWASKATISNIIGAGYGSIAKLAEADPEQLYRDFFDYGKSIGKNLKLGNEIESSFRISKIMPLILAE